MLDAYKKPNKDVHVIKFLVFVFPLNRVSFFGSGARFSKAPETFRDCEAIFNCLYLENKEACRHKTLHEGQLYSCSKYAKRTAL